MNIMVIYGHDHIALMQTRARSRTCRMNVIDQHAARTLHVQRSGNIGRDRLAFDTNPWTGDILLALLYRVQNNRNHVRWNGKADTQISAALRIDGGVDADQFSIHGHKGSA